MLNVLFSLFSVGETAQCFAELFLAEAIRVLLFVTVLQFLLQKYWNMGLLCNEQTQTDYVIGFWKISLNITFDTSNIDDHNEE